MRDRDFACTEEELFRLAYQDASGKEYWRAWLFSGATQIDELANVVAIHAAHNEDQRAQATTALIAAAKFAPSISPIELAQWWRENPDTSRYVSQSLAAYLDTIRSSGNSADRPQNASANGGELHPHRVPESAKSVPTEPSPSGGLTHQISETVVNFSHVSPAADPATEDKDAPASSLGGSSLTHKQRTVRIREFLRTFMTDPIPTKEAAVAEAKKLGIFSSRAFEAEWRILPRDQKRGPGMHGRRRLPKN